MRLFNRRYRVQIGTLVTEGRGTGDQNEGVDLVFKITRTLSGRPGTCELSLYNLTEAHRNEAQANRRAFVRVEAGYVEGMAVLFQGDGRRVDTEPDGVNWATKVTAGDGEHAMRTARGSRSFGPGTPIAEVARFAAESMDVGIGNTLEALAGRDMENLGRTFPSGVVIHGLVAGHFTSLLSSLGLTWSVQDGVLQVLPRGGNLTRNVVELGPDTGLVGSPARGQHGLVQAKALLIPDLVPGQRVQLDSRVLSGVYRIEKAEYSGDTRGQDWYCEMDLRAQRSA